MKSLIRVDKVVQGARVALLGLNFKENWSDSRNSKVMDIIRELAEYGITPVVTDPVADAAEALRFYGLEIVSVEKIQNMNAVILAVAHDVFSDISASEMDRFFLTVKKSYWI